MCSDGIYCENKGASNIFLNQFCSNFFSLFLLGEKGAVLLILLLLCYYNCNDATFFLSLLFHERKRRYSATGITLGLEGGDKLNPLYCTLLTMKDFLCYFNVVYSNTYSVASLDAFQSETKNYSASEWLKTDLLFLRCVHLVIAIWHLQLLLARFSV